MNKIIEKINNNLDDYLKTVSIKELESVLFHLNDIYYTKNKDSPISDEIYDILYEKLRKINKDSEIFNKVGHLGKKDMKKLPYFLPSLSKIKSDSKAVNKFTSLYSGPYVLSDKLDGMSGLLVKEKNKLKLYSRGNGEYGQDLTRLVKYIVNKKAAKNIKNGETNYAIRGEILISRKNLVKLNKADNGIIFKNERSAANSLVNNDSKEYLKKIGKYFEFVPYAIIRPKLKINDQMKELKKLDFKVVYNIESKELTNEYLSKILMERRKNSDYPIDGIVVIDSGEIYKVQNAKPKYGFAFKMVLMDQLAESVVIGIKWDKISKDGYLIPMCYIKPIMINGAEIKKATAKNAKFVINNKIGAGAVVSMILSGDVIPNVHKIIKPAKNPDLPKTGYKWNENKTNFINTDINQEAISNINLSIIEHFVSIMNIGNAGRSTMEKIMKEGYNDLYEVLKVLLTNRESLYYISGLGKKSIDKIYDGIVIKLKNNDLNVLMAASNIFERNLGVKKIGTILDNIPNIMNTKLDKKNKESMYQKLININGIGEKTAEKFMKNLPKFKAFYNDLNKIIPLKKQINKKDIVDGIFNGKKFVFTGFRNKDLEKYITDNGGSLVNNVSKNTSFVIYKGKESSKYKKAISLDIPTMTQEEFIKKHKINIS